MNYEKVYAGRIADVTGSSDLRMQLEAVFVRFNENRPEDFKGHSLSVSDVVVVKGQAFYVDTFGFKPITDFGKAINALEQPDAAHLKKDTPSKIHKL